MKNINLLELLNIIFENSSLKEYFRANKKKIELLLLSPDSWKLLTTSPKKNTYGIRFNSFQVAKRFEYAFL